MSYCVRARVSSRGVVHASTFPVLGNTKDGRCPTLMLVWPIQDDVAAGFQSSEGPQWPTGGEVLLLSTLPCLFPCSDFAHPVTTPYMLTLAQVRRRTHTLVCMG